PKAPGVRRPARFATAPASGAKILTLQRPNQKHDTTIAADFGTPVTESKEPVPIKASKAPKAEPSAKDTDLPHLLGAWELTDVDGLTPEAASQKLDQQASAPRQDGGPVTPRMPQRWEALRRLHLLPGGGPIDLPNRPLSTSYVAYVETDASKSPKWITLRAL